MGAGIAVPAAKTCPSGKSGPDIRRRFLLYLQQVGAEIVAPFAHQHAIIMEMSCTNADDCTALYSAVITTQAEKNCG
jgi:hypothetical protein